MDDPTSSFPASELKEKHDMSLITDDFWSKESLRDRESQASDFVLHHTDPIFQWLFHGIKPFPLIRIFVFFQNKIVESKYK